MGEIRYIKTSEADIELLMQVRLEMLREVNDLSDEYVYDETLVTESRKYFENGNQTTVLAFDNEIVVGCASLSYIWIMPTFDHPTGTRAHLMNVYTNQIIEEKVFPSEWLKCLLMKQKKKVLPRLVWMQQKWGDHYMRR